jgi:LuxR family maltose regulon positive regulatory protein
MQGQLHKAAVTCRDALALSSDWGGRRLPVAGYAHVRLSVVLRQWNDLPAALHHARAGIHLAEPWGWAEVLVGGYLNLAQALEAMGDRDGAFQAAQRAGQIAHGVSPWFEASAAALEARLWLAHGEVAAAYRWATQASSLDTGDEPGFQYEFVYLTLARACIAQGKRDPSRLDKALGWLTRLLGAAEAAGAMGYGIEILILQAMALQAQGQVDPALAALERALSLAEPEGYVRIFIDEGEPMGDLLRQAAARGIARGIAMDYVRTLLEALQSDARVSAASSAVHPMLVEPLTERELEVLRLLVVGLPNKEISRTLVIAPGTVKQHLKHVYGKLGVHNRTEAANRARDLGLV